MSASNGLKGSMDQLGSNSQVGDMEEASAIAADAGVKSVASLD